MELNDKDLIMVQNEFGDYEGHCPHCDKIFIPIGWIGSIANPVRKCMFCGGWVRLFQIIEPFVFYKIFCYNIYIKLRE